MAVQAVGPFCAQTNVTKSRSKGRAIQSMVNLMGRERDAFVADNVIKELTLMAQTRGIKRSASLQGRNWMGVPNLIDVAILLTHAMDASLVRLLLY